MPTSCGYIAVCLWLVATLAASASSNEDAAIAQRACQLADTGQFDEVEPLLARLAKSPPDSNVRLAAVLFASERAYAHGERERAAVWLKPLATSAPPRFQKAIDGALAWCEIDPTDLDFPSARLLELADEHDATSLAPVAMQLRAEKLAAAKRTDEAIFVYRGLLGRFPKSRHAPGQMLALAQLHHDLVQDRDAWQWLEKLLTDYPQAVQVPAALSLSAETARRMKAADKCEQCLQQLVKGHEASDYWPDAVCRLAEMPGARAHVTPEQLAKAIERSRDGSELHHRLLFVEVRSAVDGGDWDAVEQRAAGLLKAKVAEPLRTLAQFWYAEAAYRQGQQDAAFTRFLDLSIAHANRQEDWLGIVPLRLAQIEAHRQKWSVALERVEQLAKERPEYSRIHEADYLRGRALAALGRFSEAREALTKATTAESAGGTETAAMAAWMIGETWFQQQRYEQAIAAYDRALSCDFPHWRAAALLQAGKCCEHLSRWNEAAKRYEQVISKYGDTRYVADAKTRLATTQQQASLAAQQPGTETR